MSKKATTKRISWYKKALVKQVRETFSSVGFYILFILILALWYFLLGKGFELREIHPIEIPTIFSRLFYSALVYLTLGRILYIFDFYKALAVIVGEILGNWKLYWVIKNIVWRVLIFTMWFYILPKIINFLNFVLSLLYNALTLLLYLSAPLGISAILFISYLLIKSRIQFSKEG